MTSYTTAGAVAAACARADARRAEEMARMHAARKAYVEQERAALAVMLLDEGARQAMEEIVEAEEVREAARLPEGWADDAGCQMDLICLMGEVVAIRDAEAC